MRGILLLLALGTSPLVAQNVFYTYRAGERRVKAADDPAFARPDFDDRLGGGTFAGTSGDGGKLSHTLGSPCIHPSARNQDGLY
jgi:hypothetical protein